MKELDEKGFIFLGNNGLPYRCCMWGARAWLFAWHPSNTWVSVRPVTQMDIWTFPRNLTDEQQEHYTRLADKTAEELRPKFDR